MGTNQALKEITTAEKSYQQFPAQGHLAKLAELPPYKACFVILSSAQSGAATSKGKLQRQEVMFKTRKVYFFDLTF